MKKLIAVALLAFLAMSCTKGDGASTESAKPEDSNESLTLATVNGVDISEQDIKEEFNMLGFRAQQMFMAEGGLESLLEEMIKKEILYQEAAKRNYETNPEFKEMMDDYRKRLLIGFLLKEEVENKAQASDSEVRKYYDDNRKNFTIESPDDGKPEVLEFEAVKELIRQRLAEQKKGDIFENYIANLKKSYDVQINDTAVRQAFGNITSSDKVKP